MVIERGELIFDGLDHATHRVARRPAVEADDYILGQDRLTGAMSDLKSGMRTQAEDPPTTLNLWVHVLVHAEGSAPNRAICRIADRRFSQSSNAATRERVREESQSVLRVCTSLVSGLGLRSVRGFEPDERCSGNEGGRREPGTRARSSVCTNPHYLLARRMAEGVFESLPFAGPYRQGSACPSLPRGPRPRSHGRKKTYSPYKTERRGAKEIITNSVQIARNWQARPSCEGWRLSPIAVARLLVDPASDGNAEPVRLVRVRGL
jgi:hypothetical protein